MSASSPAGSENSPRGGLAPGRGMRILQFALKAGLYAFLVAVPVFLVLPFLGPGVGTGRGALRLECLYNLSQIGLALHNYHSTHGSFPPAYVTDAQGKPLYSWRVLILPFLKKDDLYQEFRKDEPWDSPHNLQLVDKMPAVFRCPETPRTASQFTSYVGVTGPGTVFAPDKVCRLTDITDGPDKTILIVETAETDIVWTEPKDLPLASLSFKIDLDHKEISSRHSPQPMVWNLWAKSPPDGANAIFCDGHGRFLSHSIPADTVRALCTIAGGEHVNEDDF